MLTAALALTACGGDDGDDGGGDGGGDGGDALSMTMLPKNLGNPYFDTSTAGAEEAADELGADDRGGRPRDRRSPGRPGVRTSTPSPSRASDALILSANDPEALCDAIDEARSADVKVVTFDSDTNPDCRDLFINQATAEGIAAKQLELISEQIGGAGEIAILSAAANATNQNAWIEMMEEELDVQPRLRRHRARRHRLRRRRGPEVVRPDRGAAAEPPGPQGHHLADHGRHRRRGPLPLGVGRPRARSR